MNLEHAQMLIDCLRDDADHFDMRTFFGPGDEGGILVEGCGTARCIGGHAMACMATLGQKHVYRAHSIATAVFLGITEDEAHKLCIPWIHDDVEGLDRLVLARLELDGEPLNEEELSFIWKHVEYGTLLSDITVDQAIQAINNLIDHYHELAQQY